MESFSQEDPPQETAIEAAVALNIPYIDCDNNPEGEKFLRLTRRFTLYEPAEVLLSPADSKQSTSLGSWSSSVSPQQSSSLSYEVLPEETRRTSSRIYEPDLLEAPPAFADDLILLCPHCSSRLPKYEDASSVHSLNRGEPPPKLPQKHPKLDKVRVKETFLQVCCKAHADEVLGLFRGEPIGEPLWLYHERNGGITICGNHGEPPPQLSVREDTRPVQEKLIGKEAEVNNVNRSFRPPIAEHARGEFIAQRPDQDGTFGGVHLGFEIQSNDIGPADNCFCGILTRQITVPKFMMRRKFCYCAAVFALAFIVLLLSYLYLLKLSTDQDIMMKQLADMQHRMQFLQSQYKNNNGTMNSLKDELHSRDDNQVNSTTLSPKVTALLRNITEYKMTSKGLDVNGVQIKRYVSGSDFDGIYTNAEEYYKPAFYVQSSKDVANVVIGIPSVKRENNHYLTTTLKFLVEGLSMDDYKSTLIIIFIGEVDLDYVLEVSMKLERNFYKEMKDGLIEVLSPEKNFYPDMEKLPVTLGDPPQRVQWRSKQNLDAVFLMSVAKFRGLHYLMMEDDVVAKPNYMKEITSFITSTTISHPDWVLIDFSTIGGIGKMYKTTNLAHFIPYIELFFYNMPLDWLVDSYITNRACGIDKISKDCINKKAQIRFQYKTPLFQHIGLHSSLKGKIQKIKDPKFGTLPMFVPHNNPPVIDIKTTIEENSDHKIIEAYNGKTYFWGITPKKDDYIEFNFKEPVVLRRFSIHSGNLEHLDDIFQDAYVSLKKKSQDDYIVITKFTDIGIARAEVEDNFGAVTSLKIHVNSDNDKWVIINEINIEPLRIDQP